MNQQGYVKDGNHGRNERGHGLPMKTVVALEAVLSVLILVMILVMSGGRAQTIAAEPAERVSTAMPKPKQPASAKSGPIKSTPLKPTPLKPVPLKPGPLTFAQFLSEMKAASAAKDVPPALFDQAMSGMVPDGDILGFTTRQPEHDRTPWDYIATLVSDKRIADGRIMLAEHAKTLTALEAAYGVDKHILIAIWGIESSYGSGQGGRNVLQSLATLAFQDHRRANFWKKQLIAALQIVANGDIAAKDMGGSWAGAMGHTQFMPTTYNAHAVDFDGDGKRDIWRSVPDALASTANYLRASNWQKDIVWGAEVFLPAKFDYALSAADIAKPLADWLGLGVSVPDTATLPTGTDHLRLILPAGATGPAFFVSSNFKSILRYNNATLYALSAGLLASRLQGGAPLQTAWPTAEKPLQNRAQRQELQQLLVDRGLDTGGVDGILGSRSQAAIRTYQQAEGLAADGYPTLALLERLRRASVAVKQQGEPAIATDSPKSDTTKPKR